MVTTAPHPDPRPDQEDQPDQQETACAPKRGDWSTWRGESVAIIVLSTLAHHPDAPGGLPGGRTVLYPRSYGQAFHTEGGWETWTQDDGSEHLQVGDLHILLRRPDPPPRVVEVPFEFDDQALGTWPVAHPQSLAGAHPQSLAGAHPQSLAGAHPQSLAGEFTQAAARGNRGPGRVLEVLLTLSLELAETGIDVVDLLNASLPGAKAGMDVLRVIEEATTAHVGAAHAMGRGTDSE